MNTMEGSSGGLDRCLSCRQILTAATTDLDWPGLCLHCARTGAGPMHVIRRATSPPGARQFREQRGEDE